MILEALDSHEYWQLSEPQYRDSGFVEDEGVNDDIRECRAIVEKIEAIRPHA